MHADLKDQWKDFARDARAMGSPLYADLALAIDGDEALKGLTARRRRGQPAANLLLAAVHFLLMRGARSSLSEVRSPRQKPSPGRFLAANTSSHASRAAPHPLADFYPTLGGRRVGAAALFAAFRDFVFGHREEIVRLVEARVTNTNEVGRSAILRAGFGALAKEEPAPLHLIEIGPSAGLNMIWDRYGVRYHKAGATVAQAGPGAALVLACELKGDGIPPVGQLPRIAGRVGLELNPVNLANADDRDWLRALIWPDQPERLARLERAIAIFLEQPVEIRAGDALDLLPAALAEAERGAAICVYHTIALYQFSGEMRGLLKAILAGRPVWQLSFEFEGGRDYAVNLTHHGRGVSRRLALAQPHGGWMAWESGALAIPS